MSPHPAFQGSRTDNKSCRANTVPNFLRMFVVQMEDGWGKSLQSPAWLHSLNLDRPHHSLMKHAGKALPADANPYTTAWIHRYMYIHDTSCLRLRLALRICSFDSTHNNFLPVLVSSLSDDQVTQVACGGTQLLAVCIARETFAPPPDVSNTAAAASSLLNLEVCGCLLLPILLILLLLLALLGTPLLPPPTIIFHFPFRIPRTPSQPPLVCFVVTSCHVY